MGRPSLYEPELVERILENIRWGMYVNEAALAAGVSKSTLHRWREEHPGFAEEVEIARAQAEQRHIRIIKRAADNGDWHASAFWLERSFPDRWGRRARLELTGADDGPVEISVSREVFESAASRFSDRVVRLADARAAKKAAS